jgi:hypothetical protein
MEQLFEKLLGGFPAYADDLLRLITGPKRFIAERLSMDKLELRDALVFLGVSYLLADVLGLPFRKGDFVVVLSVDAVAYFVEVIATGLCLCMAWRCVGGNAELKQMFSINFYYHGVAAFIYKITLLAFFGTLKEIFPDFYTILRDSLYGGRGLSYEIMAISTTSNDIARNIIEKIGVFASLLAILWLAF